MIARAVHVVDRLLWRFVASSCALAFSYRSQVELGRKVRITYTTSSHGLQLALVW